MTRLLAALVALVLLVPAAGYAGRAVVDWEYGYVNLRKGPSTSAARTGRLTLGTRVETLETRGEWVRIRAGGREGWVVARSLRPLPEPGPQAPAEAPAPAATVAPPPEAPKPEAPVVREAPAGPAPPEPGYLAKYLNQPEPDTPRAGGGWLRLVSGLLLVLALIAGGVFVARSVMGRRLALGRASPGIRILATRPLGARHGLVLVEVGGMVWLLAHGPDGVRPIAEIRDPEALKRLDERYGFLETPFESELRQKLDLESGGGEEGGPEPEPAPEPELSPEERLAALRRRPRSGSSS